MAKGREIYSTETEQCGCLLKRYFGGKVSRSGCNIHPIAIYHLCPNCGKKYDHKIEMKKCVWSHAL